MTERRVKARLASRRNITSALAVFAVEPEAKISFRPGQYVALGIRDRGELIERDYSIVSSPHEDFLEFFVERVDDGHLTARLFELETGAEVLVNSPGGMFFLDRESGHPHHLMIATVTGIAPFLSMVRTLAIDGGKGMPVGMGVTLLHGVSYADEFGYDVELRRMTTHHPWLTYIPAVSRPSETSAWHGETGRVENLIEKTLDSLQWTARDTTAYLCGHPGMIEQGKKILSDRDFPQTQIREEQYWEET
ncbi:MAG: FAD-binding oxidoreductase [candidate division NC10 bacterium]